MINGSDIILVSGHYPLDKKFAKHTKKSLEDYCDLNGYKLYYDETPPVKKEIHHLHYNRCVILKRAEIEYPDAKWFVWIDTDVWVNRFDIRIELVIDLSDPNILYHLFHEKPWDYKVNTGVKFVSKEGVKIEDGIWNMCDDVKWKMFPYEQKVMAEYIVPIYNNYVRIHDPYVLNCIDKIYPIEDAIFVHLCNRPEDFRNRFMDEIFEIRSVDKYKRITNLVYEEIIKKVS